MTEKEEVKRIVDKYNKSITELMTKGTILEVKTVFKYIADQANLKQRKLVGLDKE